MMGHGASLLQVSRRCCGLNGEFGCLNYLLLPGERRVSIERESSKQYNIFIHPFPFPSDQAKVDLDTLHPSLQIVGNPREHEYWLLMLSCRLRFLRATGSPPSE